MLLVLTNDDGIDAPGILALNEALSGIGQTAIVAPDSHLSGCSHQMNRGGAIAIEQRSDEAYAIGGTPADCSRVALSHLYPSADWVVSGINAGGNMGADVYVSGTVAAVREAALLRKPGIAISQYRDQGRPIEWERSVRLAQKVLPMLFDKPLVAGEFWNVNLPAPPREGEEAALPEVVFCEQCTQPLPTDYVIEPAGFRYVGPYEARLRDPGRDVDICLGGQVSVVKVSLW